MASCTLNQKELNERRKREDERQQALLDPFWDKGMKSWRSPLIAEAARETNLSEKEVKRYISNKGKRENRANNPQKIPRKKTKIRNARAYDCFRSHRMREPDLQKLPPEKQGEKFRIVNQEWHKLGEQDRSHWHKVAEQTNKEEPVNNQSLIERHLYRLEQECTHLWELGVKVSVLVPPHPTQDTMSVTCPKDLQSFWDEHEDDPLLSKLCQQLESSTIRRDTPRGSNAENLRKSVQDLFNEKYGEAVGKTMVKCSYRTIAEGHIQVEGLPSGIELKHPNEYNNAEKMAILNAAQQISMKVHTIPVVETNEADGEDVSSQSKGMPCDDNTLGENSTTTLQSSVTNDAPQGEAVSSQTEGMQSDDNILRDRTNTFLQPAALNAEKNTDTSDEQENTVTIDLVEIQNQNQGAWSLELFGNSDERVHEGNTAYSRLETLLMSGGTAEYEVEDEVTLLCAPSAEEQLLKTKELARKCSRPQKERKNKRQRKKKDVK